MKKQATKMTSSGKGIALKFKKPLSDTTSGHHPQRHLQSDASSTASISFVTSGVKRKREGWY